MGNFKVGQYVGVVSQKRFIEDLKDGKFKIAKITSQESTSIGCDGNILFYARDDSDQTYTAFSKCVSNGMYEFVDIDTLAYYLEMFGREKVGDGYGMIEDAKKIKDNPKYR